MDQVTVDCNLCGSELMTLVCEDKRRSFWLCGECGLVSVPGRYWLSVDDERARYDLHDNNISNDGYVKFLTQTANVVGATALGRPSMRVLDFGCGENAVLCQLLNNIGIDCHGYDPLYQQSLSDINTYNIIVLCEVIEHLRDINAELELINTLLHNGGIIIIRTQIYDAPSSFPSWWYAQDMTHINFFNMRSLQKLAAITNKQLISTDHSDIFILK